METLQRMYCLVNSLGNYVQGFRVTLHYMKLNGIHLSVGYLSASH